MATKRAAAAAPRPATDGKCGCGGAMRQGGTITLSPEARFALMRCDRCGQERRGKQL